MRRALAALVSLAAIGAGIAFASPANAAQVGTATVAANQASNPSCDGVDNNTYTASQTGGASVGPTYTFTGVSGDTVLVTNNCASQDVYVRQGGSTLTVAQNGGTQGVSLGGGGFGIYTSASGGNLIKGYGVQVTGGGNNSGGNATPTSSAPAPSLDTLTLQVSTGNTSCSGSSPTGYSGSWLQLPAADACSQSGPNVNPNARLLGWATDPIFPVSVAQQIVDLNYGPIDATFYGMRMIFIPAGGWTFVSGSNNLYPIWSN